MKGGVRGWGFDAVIGIGGIGRQAQEAGIDRKLTWIGCGNKQLTKHDPNRPFVDADNPLVTFDHFKYFGEDGMLLKKIAPHLAERMYRPFGPRRLMDSLSPEERQEVETILRLAENAPPSSQRAERDFHDTSGKCSNSCRG
jgi:hypothetical protein